MDVHDAGNERVQRYEAMLQELLDIRRERARSARLAVARLSDSRIEAARTQREEEKSEADTKAGRLFSGRDRADISQDANELAREASGEA